jgi:DNA-directed RNA polymerase specialized sigma24 family protein
MTVSLQDNYFHSRELPQNDSVLMGRADLLKLEDRDLLEAVVIRGQSAVSVARMMKIKPRAVHRRIRRLCRMVSSHAFLDAARALPYLEEPDTNLVRMRFCQGATYQDLCRHFNLSWHHVRRRLDRLAAQIETIRRITAQQGQAAKWRREDN